MAVAHRVAQERGQAFPQQFRLRDRFALQQRQGQHQIVEGTGAALVRPDGLAAAPDKVVRKEVAQGRVPVEIAHQPGQQLQVGDERAGLGRRAAKGHLAGATRIGHLPVEIQPVGRKPVRGGGGIDLLAAPEELGAVAARCRVDFNHGGVWRDGGELQRGVHGRGGTRKHQRLQATGPRGALNAGQNGEKVINAADLGQLDGGAGGGVGIRFGRVLVGAQDKLQRFGVCVRGGGHRPGRCVSAPPFCFCVFSFGGFNAFGPPLLAGERLRQGAGEGGDVRWPGGNRFGGQDRVRRAVPQGLAIAPPQQAEIPARQLFTGIQPPDAAQHQRARHQPAQGAEQRPRTKFLVVAQGGVQPGRRLGLPVGKRGLRPHPDGQAEFGDQRIMTMHRRFERVVCLHSSLTPEMPSLTPFELNQLPVAAAGLFLMRQCMQVTRQRG